jgi:hypothetical protein
MSRKSSSVAYSRDMNPLPYEPRIGPDQIGVPVVDKARPWLALRTGESLPEWHTRMSHTCWRCGAYIVDNAALDQHEDTHRAAPDV